MSESKRWLWVVIALMIVTTLACSLGGEATPSGGGAGPTQAPSGGGGGGGGAGNTGLAAYRLALPVATKWKSDAALLEIQTAPPAPLAPDGSIKPTMWSVQFYSPSAGALYAVMVQGGKAQPSAQVASQMTEDRSVPDPASLMDSDKAVSIAEQNGGAEARKKGATQAQVGLIHHALGDIRWIVNYMGADFSIQYAVHVEAKSGKVLFTGK